MVSGLYAAILALIQIKLTLDIVKIRMGQKVSLGDGGHEDLTRKIRSHGNFIETVPIALALIIIAELSGAPFWCLHALGVVLILGRVLHVIGIRSKKGHGKFRFYGMIFTLLNILLGALLCAWLSLPLILPSEILT